MAAAIADRRRARAIELAMEIVATVEADTEIDRAGDEQRARAGGFVRALGAWLRGVIAEVPGGRRAMAFLGGIVDALRAEDALEQLEDRNREHVLEAARELAGLLDGVAEPRPTVEVWPAPVAVTA